jgi:hypothetical protein
MASKNVKILLFFDQCCLYPKDVGNLQNVQGEVPLANITLLWAMDQGIIRALNKHMEVPSSETAAKIEVK